VRNSSIIPITSARITSSRGFGAPLVLELPAHSSLIFIPVEMDLCRYLLLLRSSR